jgi:hypothetical protein
MTLLLWSAGWINDDHITQAGPLSHFSGNLEFELREHAVAFFLFFSLDYWACDIEDTQRRRMSQKLASLGHISDPSTQETEAGG